MNQHLVNLAAIANTPAAAVIGQRTRDFIAKSANPELVELSVHPVRDCIYDPARKTVGYGLVQPDGLAFEMGSLYLDDGSVVGG